LFFCIERGFEGCPLDMSCTQVGLHVGFLWTGRGCQFDVDLFPIPFSPA
jgi:hypothetical protein